MSALLCGAAEADFTPAPGLQLLGQMHQRIAKYKRDPLTANAIAFRQGRETVVLVSVDICMLNDAFVRRVQKRFPHRLLLHSTHTHVAPTVFDLLTAQADPHFVRAVEAAILASAKHAIKNLKPAELFSGTGQMDQMGWNRRAMFRDGTSRMYSNSTQRGFIGLEGPRDPALPVLYIPGQAVLVNFATHPNCLEGDSFYSADLPGEVRRQLKAALGEKVVVVYLTGAAGNTAPSILDPFEPKQPWRGEAGVRRSGQYLAGEALTVIASAVQPMKSPRLRVVQTQLPIPVRPWPKAGSITDPFPRLAKWKPARKYYEDSQANWPPPAAPVMLNVIRIGDTVICTNPAELFVEFGLEIRRNSPARVTFISELTDGYCGYVCTKKAYSRGGYETWPAPTSKLAHSAGPQFVAATRKLLKRAF
ncbi:MAG: hypothetical protein PCFJNLEI_00114 [Verrucomicrobiae bacterium]|nr:hypothetical protein [Verrucomicrobiae bacterium]